FGRVAIFCFDQFEGADGVDVGEGFFPEAAVANVMGCGYPEVAGGGFFFLGFEPANDRCGGRSSLGGKVHSRVTVSHAAWYSIFRTEISSYRRSPARSSVSWSVCSS